MLLDFVKTLFGVKPPKPRPTPIAQHDFLSGDGEILTTYTTPADGS